MRLLTILLFQAWKRVVSLYLRVPLFCRPICPPCWTYQSPRAQRFFTLTKRGRERLVRLMADELGEIATGAETKVSKRKLKRLQVSRSFGFILLVKGMCLFFHPQRICVVRFHTKFTSNPPSCHTIRNSHPSVLESFLGLAAMEKRSS